MLRRLFCRHRRRGSSLPSAIYTVCLDCGKSKLRDEWTITVPLAWEEAGT